MDELKTYLTSGRERAGLSQEAVAGRTRIPLRYIQALEEGRIRDLPGQVYARGFLRSYCRTVGLDEVEALRLLNESCRGEPRDEKPRYVSPADLLVGSQRHTSGQFAYVVIAIVFLIGILVALLTVGTGTDTGNLSRIKSDRGADWTEQLPSQ